MVECRTISTLGASQYITGGQVETSSVSPRWLGLQDAAKYTGLSVPTLRNLIREGRLKASRATKRVILEILELDKFMEGSS